MDPISIFGSTIAITQHAANLLYRYDEVAEAKNLLISLEISILRLQKWEQNWFGDVRYSRAKAEEHWGENGVHHIEQVMQELKDMISQLSGGAYRLTKKSFDCQADASMGIEIPSNLTKEVEKTVEDMDRRKRGHKRFVRFLKKATVRPVQDTTRELSEKIGQLEQLSHLHYQALHGLRQLSTGSGLQDFIVRSIIFRQAAVNLWVPCRCDAFKCSLGMDIVLNKGHFGPLHVATQSSETGALCYRLLWKMNDTYGFMKLKDTTYGPPDTPKSIDEGKTLKKHMHVLVDATPQPNQVIRVDSKYSKGISRFRVEDIKSGIADSDVVTYSVLHEVGKSKLPTSVELIGSLSMKERVRLACKLSECGTQLLGTPWFASLMYPELDHVWVQTNPKKMQEFRSAFVGLDKVNQQPSSDLSDQLFEKDLFTLGVPTIRLDDMMVQDSGMLSEHQQLFYFGVLLIQLALGHKVYLDPESIDNPTSWASKLLPRVTVEMGSQYTEACTFCVGALGRGHWESSLPDKYAQVESLGSWREYLEKFIGDFYTEVYLRLYGLHESLSEKSLNAEMSELKI